MIPAVTLATRAIQRRPYSLMASLRAMGRSMEAHPFQRPAGTKGAPADWGKQARRTISQVVMFFPAIGVLLGWPLLAKRLLDSGANYEIPESMRLGYGWE